MKYICYVTGGPTKAHVTQARGGVQNITNFIIQPNENRGGINFTFESNDTLVNLENALRVRLQGINPGYNCRVEMRN
jgi:hypothetical protein